MAQRTTERAADNKRIVKPVLIPRQAGLYVRREREAQGLTRKQLAQAAGVSERLLASLELGDAPGIRLDKLFAVYDALGLELFTVGEHILEKRPWEHDKDSPVPTHASLTPAVDAAAVASSHRADDGLASTPCNAAQRRPHKTHVPAHGKLPAPAASPTTATMQDTYRKRLDSFLSCNYQLNSPQPHQHPSR